MSDSSGLPSLSFSELFSLLVSSSEKEKAYLSIGSTSGKTYTGCLLNSGERNNQTMLLELIDSDLRLTGNLTYININSVESVTVHNYKYILSKLSRGEKDNWEPQEEAPSALEINRFIKSLSDQLQDKYKIAIDIEIETIPKEEEKRKSLFKSVRSFSEYLSTFSEDNFAVDLFRKKGFSTILFKEGNAKALRAINNSLVLEQDLSGGRKGRYITEELSKEINSLL